MTNEVVAVDRFFYTALTGDATLGGIIGTKAFSEIVPPDQDGNEIAPPYVLWTMPGAADDYLTVEGTRIWADMVYAVRLVMAAESYADLEAGAARIDTVLHRASGSNVSGVIVACVRRAPFAMLELRESGPQLRHLGGLYGVNVQ